MSGIFGYLMGFVRQSGANQSDGELRLLWIVITVVYAAITVEILGSAFKVWSRRTWRRFFDYDSRRERRKVMMKRQAARAPRLAA